VPVLVAAARNRSPLSAWWRPAAAVLLAPLGLAGYWAYTAWSFHRLAGWLWMEHIMHNGFDWGRSILTQADRAMMGGPAVPSAPILATLLVLAAAVLLADWGLAERIPWSMRAYTLVLVATAICTGPSYFGSKPRYLLPAMLLALPLARVLARARPWVLIPLVAVLAVLSTWFALFIMSVPWAP
jgi:hypothetical protein